MSSKPSPELIVSSSLVSPTTFWLALATVAVAILYWYMQEDDDNWTRYCIKYPKLPRFYLLREDFRTSFSNLLNQYGDTIGLMTGSRKILLTTNLNLLRQIMIKDFNNFVDRGTKLISRSPLGKALFFAEGDDWKRSRHITSPTFTSGKLKHISKTVAKSALKLGDLLETAAKENELIPIKKITGHYTCEIIAKTGFGLDVDVLGNKDLEFFEHANKIILVNGGLARAIMIFLNRSPFLKKCLIQFFPNVQMFDPVSIEANKYFDKALTATIAKRREQRRKGLERPQTDFLDLLLNANEKAKAGKLKPADIDGNKESETDIFSDSALKGMSDWEMSGHSLLVIFAGMETTATTLQMCMFELASNQEIQEKVYKEINEVVQSESPTSEEMINLTYMEQVINETLRMYPPAPSVTREAKETKTYDGVTIPKNTMVTIPFWHIMMDPKIWPNPEKFDPERFSAEEKEKRDPLAFMAFGQGPRLCLGKRLAYLELKMALVYVLRKVKIVLNERTDPKKGSRVEFTPLGLLTPKKPVMLAFELRKREKEE